MSGPDAEGDELDARLRELFADARLDVRPAPRAEREIVTGARRLRRRRAVLTGSGTTLAVVGAAVAGLLVTNQSGGGDRETSLAARGPSETQQTSVSPLQLPDGTGSEVPDSSGSELVPPPSSSSPGATAESPDPGTTDSDAPDVLSVEGTVIGPDQYRSLRLGMSLDEAAETGIVSEVWDHPVEGRCRTYRLEGEEPGEGQVTISSEHGAVAIFTTQGVTPEGVARGSSVAELQKTYSVDAVDDSSYFVSTQEGSYEFVVFKGSIIRVGIVSDQYDC